MILLIIFLISPFAQAQSDCKQAFKTSPLATERLMEAISEKDNAKFEKALSEGADVQALDSVKETVIHVAARTNNIFALQVLKKLTEGINHQNILEQTPAHLAIKHFDNKFIQELARLNANFNIKDENGNTVFLEAVIFNNTGVLEILKNAGAHISDQNNQGDSAVHLAVRYNYLDSLKELIRLGAPIHLINQEGESPLQLASKKNANLEMITILKEHSEKEKI